MNIRFTPQAKTAFRDLYEYIEARNPHQKRRIGNNTIQNDWHFGVDMGILSPKEVYDLLLCGVIVEGYMCYLYSPSSNILSEQVNPLLPNSYNENEELKTYSAWTRNYFTNTGTSEVILECTSDAQEITSTALQIFLDKGTLYDYNQKSIITSFSGWTTTPTEPLSPILHNDKWEEIFLDWKQWREYLQSYTNRVGWENLSAEEKYIVAFNRASNIGNIATTLGTGAIFDASDRYTKTLSIQARQRRFEKLINFIEKTLGNFSINYAYDVAIKSRIEGFRESFVMYGIEGTTEQTIFFVDSNNPQLGFRNDEEGVFDYINATSGTTYETSGLRSKITSDGWVGITQPTLDYICETSLNILRWGEEYRPFYIIN